MPNTFQTLVPFGRKFTLMSVSLAAMSALIACTPAQYNLADYENPGYLAQTQAANYAANPAYKRLGFSGHSLDNYYTLPVQARQLQARPIQTLPVQTLPVQKYAEAPQPRLNPYVPPTQRFSGHSLGQPSFATPALRPRFQYHLDGFAPRVNVPQSVVRSAPVTAPTATPAPTAQPAFKPAVQPVVQPVTTPVLKPQVQPQVQPQIQPQSAPKIVSDNKNFTLKRHVPTPTPVISLTELNQAVDASPLGIGRFETRQTQDEDLSIPELPEPQKQVIRQEQAALAGVGSKSVLAGPASLRRSLDQAFERSSRLAAESLRVDEAEEVLKQAKARSKPSLEFRSTVGPRTSETTFAFSDTTVTGTSIRRSAELDLSLPIYQGGRLRAERSSANLGIETARASVAQTRAEIIQETAIAYLNVVRDRKLTDLYHQNVDLLREQQSSITELLAVNESTISEKALIDARLAAQSIRLETGLGTLRESEAHYRNLVGQAAPQNLPVPAFNLPLSLTEIQALAQQNSPELTALINQAKSAEYDIDIAKSGNKPSLNLQGVLRGAEGQSETIDRNTAAEVLLNLRVPISQGGEGKSRVRQAKIVRNRLNLEIRDAQDSLRDQIDQLWARKTASEKSQKFNQDQIEATKFAVNTIAEQREEGVATVLDLLNVQQTLLDAQIQTVEAQSRKDAASIQLLSFMGVYQ